MRQNSPDRRRARRIDLGAIRDNWRSLQARLAGAECAAKSTKADAPGWVRWSDGALCGRLPQLLSSPTSANHRLRRCWATRHRRAAAPSGRQPGMLPHGVVPVLNSQATGRLTWRNLAKTGQRLAAAIAG